MSAGPSTVARWQPTVHDAATRAPVVLRDGRTGSLCYWPVTGTGRHGAKARVRLASGTYLSVARGEVALAQLRPVTPS